jgi:hypothetical protein
MSDFLTRLVDLTRGSAPKIEPLAASRYAPENLLVADAPAAPEVETRPEANAIAQAGERNAQPRWQRRRRESGAPTDYTLEEALAPRTFPLGVRELQETPVGEAQAGAGTELRASVEELQELPAGPIPAAAEDRIEGPAARAEVFTREERTSDAGISPAIARTSAEREAIFREEPFEEATTAAERPAPLLPKSARSASVSDPGRWDSTVPTGRYSAGSGDGSPTDTEEEQPASQVFGVKRSARPGATPLFPRERATVDDAQAAAVSRVRETAAADRTLQRDSEAPLAPIHVTIGRIEVRAVQTPGKAPAPPVNRGPRLSLDEYLKQQSGKRA